jgi:hypothetical protein
LKDGKPVLVQESFAVFESGVGKWSVRFNQKKKAAANARDRSGKDFVKGKKDNSHVQSDPQLAVDDSEDPLQLFEHGDDDEREEKKQRKKRVKGSGHNAKLAAGFESSRKPNPRFTLCPSVRATWNCSCNNANFNTQRCLKCNVARPACQQNEKCLFSHDNAALVKLRASTDCDDDRCSYTKGDHSTKPSITILFKRSGKLISKIIPCGFKHQTKESLVIGNAGSDLTEMTRCNVQAEAKGGNVSFVNGTIIPWGQQFGVAIVHHFAYPSGKKIFDEIHLHSGVHSWTAKVSEMVRLAPDLDVWPIPNGTFPGKAPPIGVCPKSGSPVSLLFVEPQSRRVVVTHGNIGTAVSESEVEYNCSTVPGACSAAVWSRPDSGKQLIIGFHQTSDDSTKDKRYFIPITEHLLGAMKARRPMLN